MKFKRGDTVKVIAGKYKGKTGVIKQIDSKNNRIFFESLIKNKKHVKPSNLHPDGGIIEIDGSIHASNAMILTGKEGKKDTSVSRIGYKFVNNKKIRISKKTRKDI